jgi:alanine transaminase
MASRSPIAKTPAKPHPVRLSQVISLLEYPELMSHPLASQIYPSDTIERAKKLYEEIGSVGAYTHSKGVKEIRGRVAQFIERESAWRVVGRVV